MLRARLWMSAALLCTALACNCGQGTFHFGGNDGGGGDGGRGQGGDSGNNGGSDSGNNNGTDSGSFYYDGGCGPIDAGFPPYPHLCAPPTLNECDGTTDAWLTAHGVPASRLNGSGGNGFDDDCDGLADEGCGCTTFGATKPCYLVPATQVDATGHPVGWCATNSVGTVDCSGGGELSLWSGTCRGAQPPYPHDVCAPGDFNCDGLCCNPDNTGCDCPNSVVCPSTTITEAPYPPPTQIQLIDGSQWITNATQRAQAANWTWTVLGGDCDNVLPHPTFALYSGTNSTTATRIGARTPVKFDPAQNPPRFVASAGAPVISIQAVNFGSGVAGGQIYPAFGLSGDYIVQGEFDIGAQHYVCTQKVGVRAPGLRAELCWDTVGGAGGGGNDIDIHLARLQGAGCGTNGWDTVCSDKEDCYYAYGSGCRQQSGSPPGWGYPNSADSACIGWGSERTLALQHCTNPRLDLDNITCNRATDDPTKIGSFCGPENINLDNPNDGDRFTVGVNHFANHGGTSDAHPHVDVYCNGVRAVSAGYNPATGASFPVLKQGGDDTSGDFWNAAVVTVHAAGGQITSCDVAVVPSHSPDPNRDGSSQLCVESMNNQSNPSFSYGSHAFVESGSRQVSGAGSIPGTTADWCKH